MTARVTHALNDHSYCCSIVDCFGRGEPPERFGDRCARYHQKLIRQRQEDSVRLQVPLIISEFGACLDSSVCAREITQVGDECDATLSSWAYWEFKTFEDLTTSAGTGSEGFYNRNGTLQRQKVLHLSRTYVQVAQGVVKAMKFRTGNYQPPASDDILDIPGSFSATITIDTDIQAPTVIHALLQGPEEHPALSWYPNGVDVSVRMVDMPGDVPPAGFKPITSWDKNRLSILVNQAEFHGRDMFVTLVPKGHQSRVAPSVSIEAPDRFLYT